jgi:hypothetical protein
MDDLPAPPPPIMVPIQCASCEASGQAGQAAHAAAPFAGAAAPPFAPSLCPHCAALPGTQAACACGAPYTALCPACQLLVPPPEEEEEEWGQCYHCYCSFPGEDESLCSGCELPFCSACLYQCRGAVCLEEGTLWCADCSREMYPPGYGTPQTAGHDWRKCWDCPDEEEEEEEEDRGLPEHAEVDKFVPSAETARSASEWEVLQRGGEQPSACVTAISSLSGVLAMLREGHLVGAQQQPSDSGAGETKVGAERSISTSSNSAAAPPPLSEEVMKGSSSSSSGAAPPPAAPPPPPSPLVGLLQLAACGSPYSAVDLYHALRMLGASLAQPAPPEDPGRTYLTLFSHKWFPLLHTCRPGELRRIQCCAAYLNINRSASDDIVGAVSAQKYANVPLAQVLKDLASGYEPSSLYTSAKRYFEKAMQPFFSSIIPRLIEVSGWQDSSDGGWGGLSLGSNPEGTLRYSFDTLTALYDALGVLGLPSEMDRQWGSDESSAWEPIHVDMLDEADDEEWEPTERELRAREEELLADMRALKVKMRRDGETSGAREALEEMREQRRQVELRLAKRVEDAAAAKAAAQPVALEEGLPSALRDRLRGDASAPVLVEHRVRPDGHSFYVAAALFRRVRGLPVGRRWRAMEKLGSPFAALLGFRGEGEPGSASALTAHSTPSIVAQLFAASGSVPSFQWLFEAGVFKTTAQGFGLHVVNRQGWALLPWMPDTNYLDLAVTAAAEEGHLPLVHFLQGLSQDTCHLPASAALSALRRGHTHVCQGRLQEDLGRAALGGEGATEAVLSMWAGWVESALGEKVEVSQSRERRFTPDVFSVSGRCFPEGWCSAPAKLHAIDLILATFAAEHALPLNPERVVHKLICSASLAAIGSLPPSILREACSPASPGLPDLSMAVIRGGRERMLRTLQGCTYPPFAPRFLPAAIAGVVDQLGNWGDAEYSSHDTPHASALAMLRELCTAEKAPLGEEWQQREMCAKAARFSLEALKLLRDRGASWDGRCYVTLCKGVIEYAHSKRCPLGDTLAGRQQLFQMAIAHFLTSAARSAGSSTCSVHDALIALLATGCEVARGSLSFVLQRTYMEGASATRTHSRFPSTAVTALIKASPRAAVEEAKAAFPLVICAGYSLMLALAAGGWVWTVDAARKIMRLLPSHAMMEECSIFSPATVLAQGAPLCHPTVVAAAAARRLDGHIMIKAIFDAAAAAKGLWGVGCPMSLLLKRPLFTWDPSACSAKNLLSWQVAVELGCKDSPEHCESFEAAVDEILSNPKGLGAAAGEGGSSSSSRGGDPKSIFSKAQLKRLEAAELHRHWLKNRVGGCACGGKLHAFKGILTFERCADYVDPHPLALENDVSEGRYCNRCSATHDAAPHPWLSCRICDYDECKDCQSAGGDEARARAGRGGPHFFHGLPRDRWGKAPHSFFVYPEGQALEHPEVDFHSLGASGCDHCRLSEAPMDPAKRGVAYECLGHALKEGRAADTPAAASAAAAAAAPGASASGSAPQSSAGGGEGIKGYGEVHGVMSEEGGDFDGGEEAPLLQGGIMVMHSEAGESLSAGDGKLSGKKRGRDGEERVPVRSAAAVALRERAPEAEGFYSIRKRAAIEHLYRLGEDAVAPILELWWAKEPGEPAAE